MSNTVKLRYFEEHSQKIDRIIKNWPRVGKSYLVLAKPKSLFLGFL